MSRKSVTILGVKIPLSNLTPMAVAPSTPSKEDPHSSDRKRLCDCSMRSFWEGDCDFCRAHPVPREALSYNEYCNFSTLAVGSAFDPDIMDAALECGAAYARKIGALVKAESL
jgi:hypothetical protein